MSMKCNFRGMPFVAVLGLLVLSAPMPGAADGDLPPNRWVSLQKDLAAARRGSAVRYAPAARVFFLWGFMNNNYDLQQESPTAPVPEHDMVAFDPADGRWRNHLPRAWEAEWGKKLPPVFIPRTYAGITSGSERSLFRPPTGYPAEAARPDLNIVFDQVAYHPGSQSLVYFTGGLTVAYAVAGRKWSDLAPAHSPPPVIGGSLAYDPVHDEMVLFGGGNVAEERPGGRIVGYTGTWIYSFRENDWRRLPLDVQPPPRMNTRMVCDSKNQVLVLFGGDGQSHYLADAWLYDLRSRRWRRSEAPGGPPPRAGHFTVFDPQTGWVILGGGYNRRDSTDMWAYDAALDRWRKLAGDVPVGFDLSADIAPEKRLILLVTNTKAPDDGTQCNVLYPVRTTYAFRIDPDGIARPDVAEVHPPMPKRPPGASGRREQPDPARNEAHAERLRVLPVNQWVALSDPRRAAPTRTWGSATFDSARGQILIWGGGHCGYGGSDVDAYDVAAHTWISSSEAPEYPHRQWDHGVRLAGVTFGGNPWTEHGRRIFAFDSVSGQMIAVRSVRLTTGYDPACLRDFPGEPRAAADAKVKPPTSYVKHVTWGFDPATGQWEVLGPAPPGVDTLVTTRHGVMGVNVDWPTRLNDAGHLLPWGPDHPAEDKALFRYDAARKSWTRLGERQSCPQNLYELTALAYDDRRDRVLLHGAGKDRDELWAFDLRSNRWRNLTPRVARPVGAAPPACSREAVYLPDEDVLLTCGPAKGERGTPALWAYKGDDNAWYRVAIDPPAGIEPRVVASQNRALVYDPRRRLVLLVVGTGGDQGKARIYALRYENAKAKFVGPSDR